MRRKESDQGWLRVSPSIDVDVSRMPDDISRALTAESKRLGIPLAEIFRQALLSHALQILNRPPSNVIVGPWDKSSDGKPVGMFQ